MPTDTIQLSRLLPATPARIFAAWLDAAEHSAMTGSPATIESRAVGGRFTAWDGYIDGSHLALEPGVRILQSWRSNDFPAGALDSLLEVRLEAVPEGTRITLRHGDLPEGHGPALLEGWEEFYLEPMARYFGKGRRRGAATVGAKGRGKARAAKKEVAMKGAPRKVGKAVKKVSRPVKRKMAPERKGAKPAGKAAMRRASTTTGRRR